jgi:hypothetical protein
MQELENEIIKSKILLRQAAHRHKSKVGGWALFKVGWSLTHLTVIASSAPFYLCSLSIRSLSIRHRIPPPFTTHHPLPLPFSHFFSLHKSFTRRISSKTHTGEIEHERGLSPRPWQKWHTKKASTLERKFSSLFFFVHFLSDLKITSALYKLTSDKSWFFKSSLSFIVSRGVEDPIFVLLTRDIHLLIGFKVHVTFFVCSFFFF